MERCTSIMLNLKRGECQGHESKKDGIGYCQMFSEINGDRKQKLPLWVDRYLDATVKIAAEAQGRGTNQHVLIMIYEIVI